MADSSGYALHRPERAGSLERGEQKLCALLHGTARTRRANELVIEANRDHPYVHRVVSGWACRTRTLTDGRKQCILIFLPGDLFAVKSMFVERHSDDVCMLSSGAIETLHYSEVLQLYRDDSEVADRCIWQVMEEERRLHSWVVGLGQGSAGERMAMLLIQFRDRMRHARTLGEDSLEYEMPLTQPQLADHLGITAIHVNRVLKSFRQDAIATVRQGKVSIHDLGRLRKIAYPLLDSHDKEVARG